MAMKSTSGTLTSAIRHLETLQEISSENKAEIIAHAKDKLTAGVVESTAIQILKNLSAILKHCAPPGFSLRNATEEELKALLFNLTQKDTLAASTKKQLKIVLKTYYKTINNGDLPQKARCINTRTSKHDYKLPEDLITKEEFDKLLSVCTNHRDRALLSVLYESGMRAGEIGALCIKHLTFGASEPGVSVVIPSGKTGARRNLLYQSESALRLYLAEHPFKNEPNAKLWMTVKEYKKTNNASHPLSYGSLRTMITAKAEKAGLILNKKEKSKYRAENGESAPDKYHPHNFRHTAATEKAEWMNEVQLCEWFGWVIGSDMPKRYIHRSGKNLDDLVKRQNGLLADKIPAGPITCGRCGTISSGTASACRLCLTPFSAAAYLPGDKESAMTKGVLTLAMELVEIMLKGKEEGKESLKAILEKHPELVGELSKIKKTQEA